MRSMVEGRLDEQQGPSTAFGGPPPLQMQGRMLRSAHQPITTSG